MKKILSILLALTMLYLCSAVSYANDFMSIEADGADDSGFYSPGKTYYFKIYDGDNQMKSDVLALFNLKLVINQGTGYIDTCKIVSLSDGYSYLLFKAKSSFAYRTPVQISIELKAIDKNDEDNKYDETVEFEVGYGDTVYVTGSSLDVDNADPLVEFDAALNSCHLEFGDAATYDVRLGDKRIFNLSYSQDENTAIKRSYSSAHLTFIAFTSKPVFNYYGTLKIYAPGANYLYTYDGYNDLTGISATKNGNFLSTSTNGLEYYVASDIPLNASTAATTTTSSSASSTGSASASSSAASSSLAPASTGSGSVIKQNPATGAAA